jgi:hypothetical protein
MSCFVAMYCTVLALRSDRNWTGGNAAGEFVPFAANMSLVFETTDLVHASPAMVSRCGLVVFAESSLTWEHLLNSWLPTLLTMRLDDDEEDAAESNLSKAIASRIAMLFRTFFHSVLCFTQRHVKVDIACAPMELSVATLRLLGALLQTEFALRPVSSLFGSDLQVLHLPIASPP